MMVSIYSWTSNPVPHFGNDLKYKTKGELEVEYYKDKLAKLEENKEVD